MGLTLCLSVLDPICFAICLGMMPLLSKYLHSSWVSGWPTCQSHRRHRVYRGARRVSSRLRPPFFLPHLSLLSVAMMCPIPGYCSDKYFPLQHQCNLDSLGYIVNSFDNSFQISLPPPNFCVTLLPPWMLGVRVGEAQLPGPTRFAVINPTSIISKVTQLDTIYRKYHVDLVCAAETSATSKAQKLFGQQVRSICGFKSLWSTPVACQFDRSDGEVSLRGRASGVAVFSHLPSRHALQTLPEELVATSRVVHSIHTVGEMQFQVLVIYGLACHSSQADEQTDQLVRAALEASSHLRLPTIIAGDFNCDPFALPCAPLLRDMHFTDLPTQFVRMYDKPMPPTCREVTTPDNALLCPLAASWLKSIEVLEDPLFDTHKVVVFSLDIPHQESFVSRLVLPQSWLEFPIESQYIRDAYHGLDVEPTDLTQWARKVECAVDVAYQHTQIVGGTAPSQVQHLPHRATGRCTPRQPRLLPLRTLLPKSRPGEYLPKFETHRFSTLKLLKQLRRVQALRRRIAKLTGGGSDKGLIHEWKAILLAQVPAGGFVAWCCATPEVGPPPRNPPNLDFIFTIEQVLRYQVDNEVSFDQRCWKQKLQYARHLDAKEQGHAQACAQIRNKDTPPLTELKEVVSEQCLVSVESDTRVIAYCDNPQQFSRLASLQLDGCQCRITDMDSYGLTLQHSCPDHQWKEEGIAVQDQILTKPSDIMDRLNQFWLPYWEHPNASQATAPAFEAFLDTLPELPSPVVLTDRIELWMQAVSNLKSRSARGIDGISAAELQALPQKAIQELASILCSYTQGFPPWLMVARTFAVPKCTTVPRNSDIRPITVLAQVYRLWARVVCSQLLSHYSTLLPPEIWGLLKGRGPFTASYQLQFWLEKLAFNRTPNAGLVLDLVKCFNSIHRPTVFAILLRIGMPRHILVQWSHSLAVLTRTWSFPGYDGPLKPCSHGFPEGDVFSVLAMIGVALTWTAHLKHECPYAMIGAYADNWCFASIRQLDFAILIRQTLSYVRMLFMEIDWAKTWLWATDHGHLAALKAALKQQLPNLEVARLTNALDLGAQMTYTGPPRLGKFRRRLSLFKRRCYLLQALPHDVFTKAHLASVSIYPTLYGVSLLPLGETHTNQLRVALVNGVLGPNHSRSSVLAMQFLPHLMDPAVWVILQALESARKFLISASLSDRHLFLRMLARHSGTPNECKGPVGVLKHYILRLGWTANPEGHTHVSPFLSLPLLSTSRQAWKLWVMHAWHQDVMSLTNRQALLGCNPPNVVDTLAVLCKLEPPKFSRIIQEISGAFQTAHQKQKWDATVTGECQYCSQKDSRWHRVFECPATEHIRDKHRDILEFQTFQNDLIHELPVLCQDGQFELLQTIHWTQPVASFEHQLVAQIRDLIAAGVSPHFYTDGSCQYPTLPLSRYSAFSVVLDLCVEPHERQQAARGYKTTGVIPGSLKTILMSRTQGSQNIARAELYAVLLIIEHFPMAVIHTDSQTTLDRCIRCQTHRDPMEFVNSSDFDLLCRLQESILPSHQLLKVDAHKDPRFTVDLDVCYQQLGNMVANDSAVRACNALHPWLVKECKLQCIRSLHFREALLSWYQLLLELQQHCAILNDNQTEAGTEGLTRPQLGDVFQQFQTWKINDPWIAPETLQSGSRFSSWGVLLANAMQDWMRQVTWERDDSPDGYGVTWIELTISFAMFTGFYFPIPKEISGRQQQLIILPDLETVEQHNIRLSEMANYFSIFFGQIEKLLYPHIWPARPRCLVRSLYLLGANCHSAGFKQRPSFPWQAEVVRILKEHFKGQSGVAHVSVPWLPLQRLWTVDELRKSVSGSWSTRSELMQQQAKIFKRQVKEFQRTGQRQGVLRFGG